MNSYQAIVFGFGVAVSTSAYAGESVTDLSSSAGNWSGCYVGISVGSGSQRNQSNYSEFGEDSYNQTWDEGTIKSTSFVGGASAGCDRQMGENVVGFQGQINIGTLSGSATYEDADILNPDDVPYAGTWSAQTDWYATLTGRLGHLVSPQTLIYAKGGAAYAETHYRDVGDPGYDYLYKATDSRFGWTLGAGIEQKVRENMSLTIEYNYVDFGRNSIDTVSPDDPTDVSTLNIKNSIGTINVGLNYRF